MMFHRIEVVDYTRLRANAKHSRACVCHALTCSMSASELCFFDTSFTANLSPGCRIIILCMKVPPPNRIPPQSRLIRYVSKEESTCPIHNPNLYTIVRPKRLTVAHCYARGNDLCRSDIHWSLHHITRWLIRSNAFATIDFVRIFFSPSLEFLHSIRTILDSISLTSSLIP